MSIFLPGNLLGLVSDILCQGFEFAVDPFVSFLLGRELGGPPLLGVKLLPFLLTQRQVLRRAIFLPLVIVVLKMKGGGRGGGGGGGGKQNQFDDEYGQDYDQHDQYDEYGQEQDSRQNDQGTFGGENEENGQAGLRTV